jgi:riboflavin kinase/FMN adenylyltransferase
MRKNFSGTVIQGLGKGKDFGFPTANIRLNDNNLHIESGVYAVTVTVSKEKACLGSTLHYGMLYVGTRPTLNLQNTTIEIHIFDFNDDIYEQKISFEILHKIRDEIHFESVEKLIKQLHHDSKTVYEKLRNKN